MLKLKSTNVTPPDKFVWRFPQDGWIASAYSKEDWFAQIDKHYKDNQYEQPDNWREIAENDLCRRLSGEWCIGGTPNSFIKTRFTLDAAIRGTKVLSSFMVSGEVVSSDIATKRALICSRCVANVQIPGCSSCTGMANIIASAKGKQSTKYDHLLKMCGVCLCSNEVQAWVPVKFLAKGVTPEMMETYREIDETGECWKSKALATMSDAV